MSDEITRDELEIHAASDRESGALCWSVACLFTLAGLWVLIGGDMSGLWLLATGGLLGLAAHVSWGRADRWLS